MIIPTPTAYAEQVIAELDRCGITTNRYFAWPPSNMIAGPCGESDYGAGDPEGIADLPCCAVGAMYRLLPVEFQTGDIYFTVRAHAPYFESIDKHFDGHIAFNFDNDPKGFPDKLRDWAKMAEALA